MEQLINDEMMEEKMNDILNHFEAASFSEEFLSLSDTDLIKIISNDKLHASKEEMVYEAVLRWINHNPERELYLAKLLEHVRLPLISNNYFGEKIIENPIFERNLEAKNLLFETMKYKLYYNNRYEINDQKRKPDCESYIFIAGGNSNPRQCHVYNINDNKWYELPSLNRDRIWPGMAVLNDQLYVMGGEDKYSSEFLSSMEIFNKSTCNWEKHFISMINRRTKFGVSVLNDMIYAAGGEDYSNNLNIAEKFDPQLGVWIPEKDMNYHRTAFRLVTLNNCLYAIGGYKSYSPLKSVERFDPREGKWTMVKEMNSERTMFGAAVHDGKIFVIGGKKNNFECYDPIKNTWEDIDCKIAEGHFYELIALDGLYAICTEAQMFEYYSPKTNRWKSLAPCPKRLQQFAAILYQCPLD